MCCPSFPAAGKIEQGSTDLNGITTFKGTYQMLPTNAGTSNRILVIRLPLLKEPPSDISFWLQATPNTPPLLTVYNVKINDKPTYDPPFTQIDFNAEILGGSKQGSDATYCLEFLIVGRKAQP